MNTISFIVDRLSIAQWLIVNTITLVGCLLIFGAVVYRDSEFPEKTLIAQATRKPNAVVSTPEPTPAPTPPPSPTPAPVNLKIPAVDIDAQIIEVGYNPENNEMEVPTKAEDVGWYKYGPPPGERGGTVMSAHFDTPTGAPAIFNKLGLVKEGQEFFIVNSNNQELKYVVSKVVNLPLISFPKDLIFGNKDISQVTLMTCSGVWNAATQLYSNRLAVIGELQSVKNIDYIATVSPEEEALEQFVVQGFMIEEYERKEALEGSYLRLEADREKIKVFLATNGQSAIAMDAVLTYDPEVIEFQEDLVAFTNQFAAHHARIVRPGLMQISLFTDPNWKTQDPLNTNEKEFKVAEVYFDKIGSAQGSSYIDLVKDQGEVESSVILTPNGEYIHNGINILNSVEGTAIAF